MVGTWSRAAWFFFFAGQPLTGMANMRVRCAADDVLVMCPPDTKLGPT